MSSHAIYERISDLARAVHGGSSRNSITPGEVLAEVVEGAVALLDGAQHAAITLIRRNGKHVEFESAATSDTVAKQFDSLQGQAGDGPCFDAIWQQQTVSIVDVEKEARWPGLMRKVAEETPIRSVLCFQLYTDGQELGAMNLHSDSYDAFDSDTVDHALNLATHAAIALSSARKYEQFKSGLASRDIIGQAKGIIMERYNVDAVHAFSMLSVLSQERNVRVADLAAQLVGSEHPEKS